MSELERILTDKSMEIEVALGEAREDLEAIRRREVDLVELIKRGEMMLGHSSALGRMTLHEAIAVVLRDEENQWMHVRDIANEVNARRLYQKKDGSLVEPNQIHARTKNYLQQFEKDGPRVRLREGDAPVVSPGRSKYDKLGDRLREVEADQITIPIDDIDGLVGGLPPSAFRHPAWWANEGKGSHVQARSWMNASWRVDGFDIKEGWVRFRRIAESA